MGTRILIFSYSDALPYKFNLAFFGTPGRDSMSLKTSAFLKLGCRL